MQKKILIYFIVAFLIASLGILFLVAYKEIHRSPNEIAPVVHATHSVIVVDLNGNGIVDQAELSSGQDAILAIRQISKTPEGGSEIEMFRSFTSLESYDANKDGRLDKLDPIFPYLELLFITEGGKKHKTISLKKADIVAVVFDKEKIKNPEAVKHEDNLIGKAIKANGKQLDIRVIQVTAD